MNLLDLSACTVPITGDCGAIGGVMAPMLADHGARVAVAPQLMRFPPYWPASILPRQKGS